VARVSKLLTFAGLTCVASVALAQQGFIVEPWRKAAPVQTPAQLAVAPRPMPASGLPNVAPSQRKPAPPVEAMAPRKWSPPVVQLLVDPWAKAQIATPSARPRWEPRASEIVDPWAGSRAQSPRVAAHPLPVVRTSIF
jgi:hypothetical protein